MITLKEKDDQFVSLKLRSSIHQKMLRKEKTQASMLEELYNTYKWKEFDTKIPYKSFKKKENKQFV